MYQLLRRHRGAFFTMVNYTFVADVHLGKLARMLRLLGFDTLYSNEVTAVQLTATAIEQSRILLSRYAGYKAAPHLQVFIIYSANPGEQLQQVVQHFHLKDQVDPFSRCLVCNGLLTVVPVESIQTSLQPNTRQAFHQFWQCNDCRQIYWKGSHYERMLKWVEKTEGING